MLYIYQFIFPFSNLTNTKVFQYPSAKAATCSHPSNSSQTCHYVRRVNLCLSNPRPSPNHRYFLVRIMWHHQIHYSVKVPHLQVNTSPRSNWNSYPDIRTSPFRNTLLQVWGQHMIQPTLHVPSCSQPTIWFKLLPWNRASPDHHWTYIKTSLLL